MLATFFRSVALLVLLAAPLTGQLELRFLNVGQGDAALIREGGKTALIDAGGSAGVVSYLRAFGIDTIDLVVASHNHADHIGGMTAVLSGTVVRFYLDNGVPHTTATYQRTIQAPPTSGDQNNSSVGILVEYGQFRALFTGDSELAELQYWVGNGSIPRVHVVKVAHHGSWNGTSAAWVQATRPQVAVISVGQNSYGHPSPQVIQQWEGVGARVHRTDLDGSVLVLANEDGSFVVTTERTDTTGVVRIRPFVQDSGVAAPAPTQAARRSCCRICTTGRACGNSCISRRYTCRQPPGCACDARP